jgi:hypothetical protein
LTHLNIYNCHSLESLPALPSTLTELRIANCRRMKSKELKVGQLTIQIQ